MRTRNVGAPADMEAAAEGVTPAPLTAPAVTLRDVRKVHGKGDGAGE